MSSLITRKMCKDTWYVYTVVAKQEICAKIPAQSYPSSIDTSIQYLLINGPRYVHVSCRHTPPLM